MISVGRRTAIAVAVAALWGGHGDGAMATDRAPIKGFDTRLLNLGKLQGLNLDAFNQSNRILPGRHEVGLIINGKNQGRLLVDFLEPTGDQESAPCFTAAMLRGAGVRSEIAASLPVNGCVDLASAIAQSTFRYDPNEQKLTVTLPQASLLSDRLVRVDPDRWQEGDTAAHLNYRLELAQSKTSAGESRSSLFGDLQFGANWGAWRARSFASAIAVGETRTVSFNSAYVERGVAVWGSQLQFGDVSTQINLGDSFRLRGTRIATDTEMLPLGLVSYLPTLRGVARTNAEVLVMRAGRLVYATNVPPGPFEIADAPVGSGEVTVVVKEADGTEQRFVQSNAALPVLIPQGQWRYELAAGQADLAVASPAVVYGALRYGLREGFTVYGDMTLTTAYQGMGAGVGSALGILGAVSVDLSMARSRTELGAASSGLSLRFLHAKTLDWTDTNFQLAGYRYSTQGYQSFSEAYSLDDYSRRRRSRADLMISQPLGPVSLYINGGYENYWNLPGRSISMNAGVSGTTRDLNWSLSYWRSGGAVGQGEPLVRLLLSIPLGRQSAGHMSATYAANARLESGGMDHQLGINGRYKDFNYTVIGGGRTSGDDLNVSLLTRAGVDTGRGYLEASYSRAGDSSVTSSVRAEGSILAHRGGLTLGPVARDGMVLVDTGGVGGVVINALGSPVSDARGYAIVPSISPYRVNQVSIRPESLPEDVHVSQPSASLVPTRGAIVRVKMAAAAGQSRFVRLVDQQGAPLLFGSMVRAEGKGSLGIVGKDGEAYLEGLDEVQAISVDVGGGAVCTATIRLADPAGDVVCGGVHVAPPSSAKGVKAPEHVVAQASPRGRDPATMGFGDF